MKINPSKWLCAAVAAVTTLIATSSYAWRFDGSVLCPNGTPYPGVVINITGSNCNGAFTGSVTTDASGHFFLQMPNCDGNFTATLDLTTLPAGATVISPGVSHDFFFNGSQFVTEGTINWTVNSSLCGSPPPPCPVCVDPLLGLGAAAGCTVLELGPHKVSITGPAGGILGDVCIAQGGELDMSGTEYITGTIRLGPGAKFQNSSAAPVTVVSNANLTAQISAAWAAYANAASLLCEQNYTLLDGKTVTTITGGPGVNVICVKDISLQGTQIKIIGPAGAKFIFNISGKFVLNGGGAGPQIRVDTSAGLKPSDVLYNVLGLGEDVAFNGGGGGVNCCAAIVDGTLLAPYRKIALAPGLVNGEVISGQDISIVSGSSVRCPPPCPTTSAVPHGSALPSTLPSDPTATALTQ